MELKDIPNAQLSILKEIDRVCKKNNIEYCLAYGSCLGAIRHHGFIPWDDDIDIYMMIDDYIRFLDLQSEFPDNLFIQTYKTDPDYGLLIGRVRDSKTTMIETSEVNLDINHGVFVDVYPLYNVPISPLKHKISVYEAMLCKLLLYGRSPQNRGELMKIGSSVILGIIPHAIRPFLVLKIHKKLIKRKPTGYVSTFYGDGTNWYFPIEWFVPYCYVQFETNLFPVPSHFGEYLHKQYGDYMKLPPVDKRTVHHSYSFVDLTKPFIDYKGIKYCMKK